MPWRMPWCRWPSRISCLLPVHRAMLMATESTESTEPHGYKCSCRVRFTHRERCTKCTLRKRVATESTEEHGNINAVAGCVLRTANGARSAPYEKEWPRNPRKNTARMPVRAAVPDQFSTAPLSIQTRMVSISSALRGALPCGMEIVRLSLEEIRLYSELVMAEPGWMTGPNRVSFISDA